jgi:hypothetical protein
VALCTACAPISAPRPGRRVALVPHLRDALARGMVDEARALVESAIHLEIALVQGEEA